MLPPYTKHLCFFVSRVVSIGGDGMFTEIVHGLMARTLADNSIEHLTPETNLVQPAIRIGIIPAGGSACPELSFIIIP